MEKKYDEFFIMPADCKVFEIPGDIDSEQDYKVAAAQRAERPAHALRLRCGKTAWQRLWFILQAEAAAVSVRWPIL